MLIERPWKSSQNGLHTLCEAVQIAEGSEQQWLTGVCAGWRESRSRLFGCQIDRTAGEFFCPGNTDKQSQTEAGPASGPTPSFVVPN